MARSRQELTDCGQELVGNGDHRLPLLFYHRGFIFGNLFVFGKFIVIGNQTLDAFLVPTWWESHSFDAKPQIRTTASATSVVLVMMHFFMVSPLSEA